MCGNCKKNRKKKIEWNAWKEKVEKEDGVLIRNQVCKGIGNSKGWWSSETVCFEKGDKKLDVFKNWGK